MPTTRRRGRGAAGGQHGPERLEGELAVVLSGIADGVVVQDATGRAVIANAAAAKLAGFPSPEALLAAAPAELLERFALADAQGRPLAPEELPSWAALREGLSREARLRVRERGMDEERWFLVKATPVPGVGERPRFVVNLVTDITREAARQVRPEDDRALAARERTEGELRYRIAFENLITGISTDFINLAPEEIDEGINRALATLGEFAGVDRSYVFRFGDSQGGDVPGDKARIYNTHEWCAPGIEPEIEHLQGVSTTAFDWCNVRLLAGRPVHIPRVAALPPEAATDRAGFEAQSIRSVLLVPMTLRGDVVGFLGFDAVREEKTWSDTAITHLTIVGETFVNALERWRTQVALKRERDFSAAVVETVGNLVVVFDREERIVRFNRACEELTGWRFAEVRGRTFWDFVPPEEEAAVRATTARLYAGESPNTHENHWLTRDGGRRLIAWNNTVLLDERGTPEFFISTGVDITEQAQAYQLLEDRVAERTRELSTLLDVSRTVASTLELEPLLRLILDGLKALVDYSGASIAIVQGAALVRVEYRGPRPREEMVGRRVPLDSGSALWEALRRGEWVVVDDLWGDDPAARNYRGAIGEARLRARGEAGSWLGVPLMLGDRILGLLALAHGERAHFGPGRARLVVAIAQQVAVAIANAQLYRDLQGRLSQVEGLSAVGTALVEERNLERVLRIVGEQVVALLGADGCSIALLDEDPAARPGEELELAVVLGAGEGRLQGRRLPLDGSFSGAAIRSGGPVVSTDAQHDPRGFAPTLRAAGVNGVVTVPLQTSARTVGALNVHALAGRRFGGDDIALLTLFAQQAAVAIENARLYAQSQGAAALEERQRLARELHDSVSQALYGISLGARTARTLLDRDPARAAGPLDYVLTMAAAGLAEMRALIFELRPESLAQEGIIAALAKSADSLRARHNIAVELAPCAEPDLPLERKEALYRVAQEALHNTVKHAHARRVEVRLTCEEHEVVLDIHDDGAGFDPTGSFPGHLGLKSMRERVARLGGTLEIISAPGQGTLVRAHLPHR